MTELAPHPLAPFLQPARRAIHGALDPPAQPVAEFVLFGLKMAWSCLFGTCMLILMIATHLWWPKSAPIYR
ncbi:MAG: hypothetical protein WDN06_11310 [Asticcacaulis sp.]